MSEFLGKGWNDPINRGDMIRSVTPVEAEEGIRQSIWIILGTAKGERVMRPDFGSRLHEFVFAVNDAATRARAAAAIREDLTLLEPRIDVLDVQVASQPKTPNVLRIQIDYRTRTTNNVFNMVYPFYLEERGPL